MTDTYRPYVQIAVNAIDLVLSDPDCRYDANQFDRYETFDAARDAALTSVEVMLDEQDYDDEEHRGELETMRQLLESAVSLEDLLAQPSYRRFLEPLKPVLTAA
jgi:hypothetical protein